MDDLELTNLAAKACGGYLVCQSIFGDTYKIGDREIFWSPLDDDCAAFRLAVTLMLTIDIAPWGSSVSPWNSSDTGECVRHSAYPADRFATTRRAIVRTAAEIGRSMP